MKKALIIGSNSSSSKFDNGMVIRQAIIERTLRTKGFEVEVFQSDLKLKESSFDLVVTLSVRRIGLAFKLANQNSGVWIDFCDSWIYQRFSWNTGTRLNLVGFIECFILLRHRTKMKHCKVTYVSSFDVEFDHVLHRILSISNPTVLKNSNKPISVKKSPVSSRRLVFVGNGKYFPNILATLELSLLIGPRISSKNNRHKINIYGKGWPRWMKLLPNISLHGYIAEDELYLSSDVHLAPMRQRAGVKNKILIPLEAGIPVIAYRASVNGIEKSNKLFVADNISEYSRLIMRLLESTGTTSR